MFVSPDLLKNETLGSTTTRHTLNGLTPGRLYVVTVVTEAGGLQSSRTVEAWTGDANRNGAMWMKEKVLTLRSLTSARRHFQRHLGKQRHQPQVVVATSRRRRGRHGGHLLRQRHDSAGNDSAWKRHRGRCLPAHPWLGLSGGSDVSQRLSDEPIKIHRQDR